jgi:hypothetical protein
LLYSSRSQDDVIHRDELERLSGNGLIVVHALTDSQLPGWTSYARRVDAEMLAEVAPSPCLTRRCLHLRPTADQGAARVSGQGSDRRNAPAGRATMGGFRTSS